MLSVAESLKAVVLFSKLSQPEISTLATAAIARTFQKNTIVVTEGERSNSLYAILSGWVKVLVSDGHGRELVITVMDPGEYFGEFALDERPRSASTGTLEPSKLAMIANEILRTFIGSHPDAARHFIRELIGRARRATESFKSLTMLDVYGRVAKLLLDLAKQVDGRLNVDERLTHRDIADRISASREIVSRIVKDLTTGGYIAIQGGKIIIRRQPPPGW
jgi:CRP/FNR family cyclic AMP-dependent transcriptional regulator